MVVFIKVKVGRKSRRSFIEKPKVFV